MLFCAILTAVLFPVMVVGQTSQTSEVVEVVNEPQTQEPQVASLAEEVFLTSESALTQVTIQEELKLPLSDRQNQSYIGKIWKDRKYSIIASIVGISLAGVIGSFAYAFWPGRKTPVTDDYQYEPYISEVTLEQIIPNTSPITPSDHTGNMLIWIIVIFVLLLITVAFYIYYEFFTVDFSEDEYSAKNADTKEKSKSKAKPPDVKPKISPKDKKEPTPKKEKTKSVKKINSWFSWI